LLFFRIFQLHPIAINVTFVTDTKIREDFLKNTSIELPKVFFSVAGAAIGSVENIPIRLNGILIEDLFGPKQALVEPILSHYKMQAVRQAYKIFGSLGIIGNPVQLVNELGDGVMDFFYEPAKVCIIAVDFF
jgi:vacuolar protein sorting-associated protein 13A/C